MEPWYEKLYVCPMEPKNRDRGSKRTKKIRQMNVVLKTCIVSCTGQNCVTSRKKSITSLFAVAVLFGAIGLCWFHACTASILCSVAFLIFVNLMEENTMIGLLILQIVCI